MEVGGEEREEFMWREEFIRFLAGCVCVGTALSKTQGEKWR